MSIRDNMLTMLIVWEVMLDHTMSSDDVQLNPDSVEEWQLEMNVLWQGVGYYEMRGLVIDMIAPWVDQVHAVLEQQLGDDALTQIGLDAFDWELVPDLLKRIDWKEISKPIAFPDPTRIAAILIAEAAIVRGRRLG